MNIIWPGDTALPTTDRGLAYGDGVFETIRMQANGGVLLHSHIARMMAGAAVLGIPVSEPDLRDVIRQACGQAHEPEGWVLKLILTRGVGGRGYRPSGDMIPNLIVSTGSLPPCPDHGGVSVAVSKVPLMVNPYLAGVKTLNRLEQVLASQDLTDDVYEMIMANLAGDLVEGTRTNLLVRTDDCWLTPPTGQLAVAGIMRDHVVRTLAENGERVEQRAIAPGILHSAECRGMYLMNSLIGVVPVRKITGRDLPVDNSLATIFNPLDLLESQV
ncbi:aminodeoxychorismate lyase [Marinobacter sp.]|uniref:aminodeoxychorismate lyase n=1 Tax=Marinobacter sp. TaxID=50741 RepID=UPI0034A36BF3